MVRAVCDPRTRAYVARGTTEGRSKRGFIRALTRHVARGSYPAAPKASNHPLDER